MNRKLSPQELSSLLNRSISQLDRAIARKLAAVRMDAMQHQRQPARASGWQQLSGRIHDHAPPGSRLIGRWGALAFIVLLLSGAGFYWLFTEHMLGAVDIAILTDDMPLDVYVD